MKDREGDTRGEEYIKRLERKALNELDKLYKLLLKQEKLFEDYQLQLDKFLPQKNETFQEFICPRRFEDYRALCKLREEEKLLKDQTQLELDKLSEPKTLLELFTELLFGRKKHLEDYQLKRDELFAKREETEKLQELISSRYLKEYKAICELREEYKLLKHQTQLELDKLRKEDKRKLERNLNWISSGKRISSLNRNISLIWISSLNGQSSFNWMSFLNGKTSLKSISCNWTSSLNNFKGLYLPDISKSTERSVSSVKRKSSL